MKKINHIKDLKPDTRNARKHNPRNIGMISDALRDVGAARSGVIDEHGNILAGNGTYEALAEAGIEKVKVVEADGHEWVVVKRAGLSKEEKARLAVYDNRTAELADWDSDIIGELKDEFPDMFDKIFSEDELADILGPEEPEHMEGEDSVPSVPKVAKTKPGDVYTMGTHRLMCGNSASLEQIDQLLAKGKVDFVFTDPPYNIDYDFNENGMVQTGQRTARFGKIKNDSMPLGDFEKMIGDVFGNLRESMKEGASYYISSGRESTQTFNWILAELGFHVQSWLVWVKENFNISRCDYHPKHEIITYGWKKGKPHKWYSDRSQVDVLDIARDKETVHPTQKPVSLIEYLMLNSSKQGDLVFDPFGGSGSTLIACEKLDRQCFMMELDEAYCDVIVTRFNELFPEAPIFLNDEEIIWDAEQIPEPA